MSNITTFSSAGLPAVSSLVTALRNIAVDVGPAGTAILKMDKTGHWVFGADQAEIEEDSKWAINPFSFVHGYICWGDGEVLGEKMVSTSQPLPELEPAPPQSKKGWEIQAGLSLRCISGEDAGLQARYNTTSVGGKRAVLALGAAIVAQVERDQSKPVPVVLLKKEHYQHKNYGRIYTPVFEIVEWVSMEGDASSGDDETPPPAAAARRRRAA
jgi:hypothetical protein